MLANWAALSLMLEWRARTDLRVKLVGLVRNPLAVQHSSQKLFGSRPSVRQFGWAEAYRNLLALRGMLDDEALLLMRHEDIIARPRLEMERLCRFVGIDPDPAMGSQITGETQERWRSDPSFTLELDPATAQIARAFGYGDAELVNPHGAPAEASRRPPLMKPRPLHAIQNRLRDRVVRPARMRRHQNDSPEN